MKDLSIWDSFVEQGKLKEVLFGQCLEIYGDVTPANKVQDINEHWDIKLTITNPETQLGKVGDDLRFDVKSLRKIYRTDENVNENFYYIELSNVNGKPGSLYGKSDYIAFEKYIEWIIVERSKLITFIEQYLENPKYCFHQPLLYAIYTRSNRQDEIMLVETKKLEEIATLIINKKL